MNEKPTMQDAIDAGSGTLHGAIDYWQRRALDAETTLEAFQCADETTRKLADNYIKITCGEIHPDDAAVDRFAEAMKAKLAKKRNEGRRGWQDEKACPAGLLQKMLVDHLAKGDPVDIGNFAMMIWNRGESVNDRGEE